MDLGLSLKTSRRCLLRSGMLNVAYNARGLQSLGFLYAMLPGLREIHKDDAAFAQSCARYSQHFNCHVIWAPFLCGAFLHSERQIASGTIKPEVVSTFKETTLNSLSAVGDSFVSGSLMVSIMLILSCLILLDNPYAVCCFLLIWLSCMFLLKFFSFYLGLARGFTMLRYIRRMNLINKGDYLKIFNGILLASFLGLALGFPPESAGDGALPSIVWTWFLPIGVMLLLSYAVARVHLSRTLAIAAMVIATSIFI